MKTKNFFRIFSYLLLFGNISSSNVSGTLNDIKPTFCMKEKAVCIPNNYSKYDLPNEGATTVSLGVKIIDIPKIDDNDFIVTLDVYFSILWTEPRLVINEEKFQKILGARYKIPVEKSFLNELWLPDVEILNLKNLETKDVFTKLENQWLTAKFEIGHEVAGRISFICSMAFENFPLDIQVCLFQVWFLKHKQAAQKTNIIKLSLCDADWVLQILQLTAYILR